MIKPKISVIMPNYNGETYLEESINSILNQTFKDFEFIIIDDGSIDNSVRIIKKYLKKDNRIKLLINKKNLGIIQSLNKGLKIAKGDYIARMDSDDISLPSRLEIEYQYLKKNKDIFLVGTSYQIINEEGKKLFDIQTFFPSELVRKKLLKKCIIAHPTVMFHNDGCWYYRDKAIYCEDYDLWLRLLQKGKKMVILKEILLKYRVRKNSICNSKSKQQKLFTKEILRWNKNISLKISEGYKEFNPLLILNKSYHNALFNQINYISLLIKGKILRSYCNIKNFLKKSNS
jgi:GT2 family glycosyltransferase